MDRHLDDLLAHINDTYRFGSKLTQNIIDQWFKEYTLEVQDKFVVYDELDALQIKIANHPNTLIKSQLLKLFKCIEHERKLHQSVLLNWFNEQKIDEKIQQDILKNLMEKGYVIIDDAPKVETGAEFDFDIPDNFLDLEDDLDSLLDDAEFKEHVDSLDDVIDKSWNLEYLTQLQTGDEIQQKKATRNLVEANKKLVWKIVSHYSGLSTVGFDANDMYQVGVMGLLKAAEKFDHSLGNQFSTYAIWWIRQAITRGIADHSTLIRIPVHQREKMNKFMKIENELWNKLARPATTAELSDALEEPIEIINRLRFYIDQSNLDSLDRLVGDGHDTPISEFIIDDQLTPLDEEYFQTELRNVLEETLQSRLTEREMQVLYYRFGFQNDSTMTLEEVGQIFNVTRERIRQIEVRALGKLKQNKATTVLKEYLYGY